MTKKNKKKINKRKITKKETFQKRKSRYDSKILKRGVLNMIG